MEALLPTLLALAAQQQKPAKLLGAHLRKLLTNAQLWHKVIRSGALVITIVDLIKRYEANELQLHGLAIQLLEKIVYIGSSSSGRGTSSVETENEFCDALAHPETIEVLLRIGLEHRGVSTSCFRILRRIVELRDEVLEPLFTITLSLVDQVPSPLFAGNYIDLFDFTLRILQKEEEAEVEGKERRKLVTQQGLELIASLVGLVQQTTGGKANYFIERNVSLLLSLYLPLPNGHSQVPVHGELCVRLLTGLALLHTNHTRQMLACGAVSRIVELLLVPNERLSSVGGEIDGSSSSRNSSSSSSSSSREDLNRAIFKFLAVACSDSEVKSEILRRLPLSVVADTVHTSTPLVLEASCCFFAAAAAHDSTCSYSSEDQVMFLRLALAACVELFGDAVSFDQEEDQQQRIKGANKSPRFRARSREAINSGYNEEVTSIEIEKKRLLLAGEEAVPPYVSAGRALFYLSMFDLKHKEALADVIAVGRAKILRYFSTPDSIDLKRLGLAESLCYLCGWQEASLKHASALEISLQMVQDLPYIADLEDAVSISALYTHNADDVKEAELLAQTQELREQGVSLGVLITGCDEDDTGSATPRTLSDELLMPSVRLEMALEDTALIFEEDSSQARKLLLAVLPYIANVTEDWKEEATDAVFRKILLLKTYLSLRSLDSSSEDALSALVDVPKLIEMLVEMLSEGINFLLAECPGIDIVCMQTLSLLLLCYRTTAATSAGAAGSLPVVEGGNNSFNSAAQFLCEYCILGITANPDFQNITDSEDTTLVFTRLSVVLSLLPYDRTLRRFVVKVFSSLYVALNRVNRHFATCSLMHLALSCRESLGKIDEMAEECLLSTVVAALRSGNSHEQHMACKLIGTAGRTFPGLIHRAFGRKEVEDELWCLLRNTRQQTLAQVLHTLNACTICIRESNHRPFWLAFEGAYEVIVYKPGLSNRFLLQPGVLEKLALVLERLSVDEEAYQLHVYGAILEMSTAVAFVAMDGTLNLPTTTTSMMKEKLLKLFLPLLPNLVRFFLQRKKREEADEDEDERLSMVERPPSFLAKKPASPKLTQTSSAPLLSALSSSSSSSSSFSSSNSKEPPQPQQQSRPKSTASRLLSKTKQAFGYDRQRSASVDSASSSSTSSTSTSSSSSTSSLNQHQQSKTTTNPKSSSPTSRAYQKFKGSNVSSGSSAAYEFLAEKTLSFIFGLFCLDKASPLLAYSRYEALFASKPFVSLVLSVSLLMKKYPSNQSIQRRGVEVFRHFIENGIELLHLAQHAPHALMRSLLACSEIVEHQRSFAKITAKLCHFTVQEGAKRAAREWLIRYNCHLGLSEIIQTKEKEASSLACEAIVELIGDDANANERADILSHGTNLVLNVFALLESKSSDKRILMEGLRAINALKNTTEFKSLIFPSSAAVSSSSSSSSSTSSVSPPSEISRHAVLKSAYLSLSSLFNSHQLGPEYQTKHHLTETQRLLESLEKILLESNMESSCCVS